MYAILKAYGIPIVIIKACMMLYTNITSLVRSTDGYTEFFNAEVLQGDTLAPPLFIICLDYVLRLSIDQHSEKGFTFHKSRSRQYTVVTITDAYYNMTLHYLPIHNAMLKYWYKHSKNR